MLEILILVKLCKRLGRQARAKGHRALGYQLLLVLLWFGGEFAGVFLGVLGLILLYGHEAEEVWFFAYPVMIAGAALGAWGAFRIVKNLPDLPSEEADFYRDSNIEIT